MMKKRMIALGMVLILVLMTATGCSGKKEDKGASLQVVLSSTYVFEEQAKALEQELIAALPQLNTENAELKLTYIAAGDSEKDPYTTMAAVAQMGGMMAGKEVELLICDAETARRYAENGEAYVPFSELFTQEEINQLGLQPASVPLSDDEGNLTGEMSAACGVDLSDCTKLEKLLKINDLGAYVLVNMPNLDNAKAVITHLAGMK